MPTIRVSSYLQYNVCRPTSILFKVAAARTDRQQVNHEQLIVDPPMEIEALDVAIAGNQMHRLRVQPCQLTVRYEADISTTLQTTDTDDVSETHVGEIPADVLTYLNPSRYCESELLSRFALEEFGDVRPGFTRVEAICDWVHDHLDYTPGSTNIWTTAADVVVMRTGVCRDFAHLAISLCRSVGIPARYVSGYAANLQPPDFHAFMEAFLDGQWYYFDPTKLADVDALVRIATGRDASDVAFATITGDAILNAKSVSALYALE